MLVNEDNYDILRRISERTMTNYNIRWFNAENIEGYIEADDLFGMAEDLYCEIEKLEEKLEDVVRDRNDNYRQITPSEMYEI